MPCQTECIALSRYISTIFLAFQSGSHPDFFVRPTGTPHPGRTKRGGPPKNWVVQGNFPKKTLALCAKPKPGPEDWDPPHECSCHRPTHSPAALVVVSASHVLAGLQMIVGTPFSHFLKCSGLMPGSCNQFTAHPVFTKMTTIFACQVKICAGVIFASFSRTFFCVICLFAGMAIHMGMMR